MSSLPFELTIYVGKEIYTRYFSPDEPTAKQTAHWHLSKGATLVEILEKATKNKITYKREGNDIFSPESGEEIFESPGIKELTIQVASLEKALRSERLAHSKTKAKKEDEMESSPEYPNVLFLFEFWKRVCRHPNAKLDLGRYRDILKILRDEGVEMCARAIAGAAFDSYGAENKAGKRITYNDWEFIFRNRTNFEKECNRAPRDWKIIYQFTLEETA